MRDWSDAEVKRLVNDALLFGAVCGGVVASVLTLVFLMIIT